MERKTMVAETEYTDGFASNIKTAVLTGALDETATAGGVSLEEAEVMFREAMSVEYHSHIDARRQLYEKAVEVGDENTIAVTKQNLEAMKDSLGNMFSSGHSRFNKAKDAFENGDITVDFVEFSSEDHGGDGAISATEFGVSEGDHIPIVESSSGNVYPLVPEADENGHSMCVCHDKHLNDGFPVCKHELVWLLTQVVLYERGCNQLIDSPVRIILQAIEASMTAETSGSTVEIEVVGNPEENPFVFPS